VVLKFMVIRNNFHELIRICCIFKGGFFGIDVLDILCFDDVSFLK